jgi:catechol 2,3-dioxygenase-like lactoylglutathione lyase family enzyme
MVRQAQAALEFPRARVNDPRLRHSIDQEEHLMIGYVTLGTNDLARAAKFYDAIAKELGVGRMMETERFIAWGEEGGAAGIGLTLPFDGKQATVGNGVMVALSAKDKGQVDRLHRLALSLGGKDEGAPGARGEGFYAGYFRDLDGNKLNVFVIG